MTITTEYLSAAEVAKELGVTVRRIYQYVDDGWLRATRFGKLVLVFTRADLNHFLKGLEERREARGARNRNRAPKPTPVGKSTVAATQLDFPEVEK